MSQSRAYRQIQDAASLASQRVFHGASQDVLQKVNDARIFGLFMQYDEESIKKRLMSMPLFHGRQPYVWAKDVVNFRVASGVSREVWRQTKDLLQENPMWDVRNIILGFLEHPTWYAKPSYNPRGRDV